MMKTIIKSILLLAILFTYNDVKAQATPSCAGTGTNVSSLPCSYTPNWDWQNPTASNWYGQISTGTLAMASPFTSGTNTDDMLKIIDGLDYDPAQGWVLFAKDFGCIGQSNANNATPYFMLYNKYRSIIRLFLYYGNTNSFINRASVILRWSGNNGSLANNSLLTLANNFALANENYPISNNPESHLNYLNQVSNSGAWGVTEYLVNFDPNTTKVPSNFQYINFDFKLSTNSAIAMDGKFNFSTKSATTKEPPSPTTNIGNPNLLDYAVTGKNVLAKAPKKSEIVSGFNKIASAVDSTDAQFCSKFTRSLHNVNNSLQNGKLKDYLVGAADFAEDVGGVLGAAVTVLDLFMSKSNSAVSTNTETFIQPTISEGSIKLSGTIITESNPLSISLQLPGTSHTFSSGLVQCSNLPVYDCPLGVLSLQEAPGIEVRTFTVSGGSGFFNCSADYGRATSVGCGSVPTGVSEFSLGACGVNTMLFRRQQTCGAIIPSKTLKSYKVTGDIKLALNAQAGVVIESAKAALLFEITNNNGVPAMDLFQTATTSTPTIDPLDLVPANCGIFSPNTCLSPGTPPFNPQAVFAPTVLFPNYARGLLNSGHLKLSDFDSTGGFHKFQTPFIDINKFKNTSVTIEDGAKVYLKILVTMRSTNLSDDQTPIVQMITYDIPSNKFSNNGTLSPYTMTCDQRLEEDVTLVGLSNTTSAIGNVTYSGYAIQSAPAATITANPTTTTNLQAFAFIRLSAEFKTQMQTGALFKAFLNPGTQGCASGGNALVVQTHTYNCSGNAASNKTALAIPYIDYEGSIRYEDGELSLAEELQKIHMRIAPNPNSGDFRLYFTKKIDNGIIQVYNALGQQVFQQELSGEANMYDLLLRSYLSSGVYYLTWRNETYIINQKFIVH